jgi:hypothetical protein
VLWTCRPRAAVLGLDKPDLIEVRAPKPTQVLLTTEDNCFPYSGGVKAVTEAAAAFAAMGDAAALDVSTAVYHHGWCNKNREAMYTFFDKHLMATTTTTASSSADSSSADSSSSDSGSGSGVSSDSLPSDRSAEWWPNGFGNLSALFNATQLQVTSTGQVRPQKTPLASRVSLRMLVQSLSW